MCSLLTVSYDRTIPGPQFECSRTRVTDSSTSISPLFNRSNLTRTASFSLWPVQRCCACTVLCTCISTALPLDLCPRLTCASVPHLACSIKRAHSRPSIAGRVGGVYVSLQSALLVLLYADQMCHDRANLLTGSLARRTHVAFVSFGGITHFCEHPSIIPAGFACVCCACVSVHCALTFNFCCRYARSADWTLLDLLSTRSLPPRKANRFSQILGIWIPFQMEPS